MLENIWKMKNYEQIHWWTYLKSKMLDHALVERAFFWSKRKLTILLYIIYSKNKNRSLICTCILQSEKYLHFFSIYLRFSFICMLLTNTLCSKWQARFVSWLGRASFGLEIDNIWYSLPWPWHQIFYFSKIVSFRLRAEKRLLKHFAF